MSTTDNQDSTANYGYIDTFVSEFVNAPSLPEKLLEQTWLMEVAGRLKREEWDTFMLKAEAYRAANHASRITKGELTASLRALERKLRDQRRAARDSLYLDQAIRESQQGGDDTANRVLPLGFDFKRPEEKRKVTVPLDTVTESNIIRAILQTSKDAGYQIVSDGTHLYINKRATQMIDGQNKSVFSLTNGSLSNVLSILSNECEFSRENAEFRCDLYGLYKREAARTQQRIEDVRMSPHEMLQKRQEEMDAVEHRRGPVLWGPLPSKLTEQGRSGGTVDVASRLGFRLKEMGNWAPVEDGVRARFMKVQRTGRKAPWRVEVKRAGTLI